MADVTKLIPHILKWEGGYVNDPDDLGRETCKGVTYQTYKLYRRRKGLPEPTVEDLKNLSDEEFTDILKTLYWDVCLGDRINSQSVANAIVDWAWNSGTKTAVREVQRILGVEDDGIIGNITLAAINSYSPLPLFGAIQTARKFYIERICISRPKNKKYLKGWHNRISALYFED